MPRSNLGATTSQYPTLWFYVGSNSHDVESIKFTVFASSNPANRETWTAQIPPKFPKLETGLLKIKYPGRALQSGNYEWELNYQQAGCSKPQTLSGYIHKQIAPRLLSIDNPQARWRSYASNGIWYELLDELIVARKQQPDNSLLTADFRSLFFDSKDVNYTLAADETAIDRDLSEKIVTASVLKCCEFVKAK
jgi:Domain of Unknown Function (DUF928)